MGTAVSVLQVPCRDVNVNSPAPSAEVRNKWSCNSMAWERGFTFTSSQIVHWVNNTSIQKAPGSNLCNRSVKYDPDHLSVF
jgi:hypothetical protein